ncbi:head maturation protease, ClpP-related [Corynebacterium qintianiae]|uniref:head maturation protease, ClpP-related n=1 Tax=Corynebacterium qintianiae TaxID=2709392 RepID=UPI0013EE3DB7|nr:head maturation protease, ClpP-related [Corynebacterium qintianiae]
MIEAYEDVTSELSKRIAAELSEADGADVTVRLCSGGGSVFAGHAIVARLRDYPGRVTVVVDGLAASAASFIAVAGADELVMSEGSELMIHEAAMAFNGSASEFRKSADDLERWTRTIAGVYARKSGVPVEQWLLLMQEETWFTDEEAVASGLADRIQSAPVPVAAVGELESVVAKFDYRGRRGAPPAEILRKEENMSWESLANDLGVSEGELKASLLKVVKNEAVQISGEVDVTYPGDVTIVPTEKIRIEPVVGDKPAEGERPAEPVNEVDGELRSTAVDLALNSGLSFEMGDVAEGFTAEVDAQTGVVTVKAPSGAEVGSIAEFTVLVNETAVPLAVKVRSLSGDEEDTADGENPAPAEAEPPAQPTNKVSLDRDTYDLLVKQAQDGVRMSEETARKDRVAEVDNWVATGRIASAQREKALSVMNRDPELAREVYGSNPENTVPVTELGHVGGGMPKNKAEEMLAKANAIRNNKKGA